MEGIGPFIKRRRAELGLSQRKLAKAAGMTASYLSQVEQSTDKWPEKYIPGIAAGLGVTQYDLAVAAGKIQEEPQTSAQMREWYEQASPPDKLAALLSTVLLRQWIDSESGGDAGKVIDSFLANLRQFIDFEITTDEDDAERKTFSISIGPMTDDAVEFLEELGPPPFSDADGVAYHPPTESTRLDPPTN